MISIILNQAHHHAGGTTSMQDWQLSKPKVLRTPTNMEATRLTVNRITTSARITGSSLHTHVDLAPHHVISQTKSSPRRLSFLFHIKLSSGGQFCKISFRWKLRGSSACPLPVTANECTEISCHCYGLHLCFSCCAAAACSAMSYPTIWEKNVNFPPLKVLLTAGLEHVSVTGRLLWEMFVGGSLFHIILHIWHDIQSP